MNDRDQRFSEAQLTTQQEPPIEQPAQQPVAREKMLTKMHNKLGRLHLFAAFAERPGNVTFQTQEPDEQVLVFLRKSQWINVPWIAITILLLFLPVALYLLQSSFAAFIPPVKVLLILIPFYYLFVAIYAFVNFVTWYYNAAIITNKRIVDIDFHQIVFK